MVERNQGEVMPLAETPSLSFWSVCPRNAHNLWVTQGAVFVHTLYGG